MPPLEEGAQLGYFIRSGYAIMHGKGDCASRIPAFNGFFGSRSLWTPSRIFLIGPHQHRFFDDMPLHRFLHILLARLLQAGKRDVERVELVKIAIAADRRAGAACIIGAGAFSAAIKTNRSGSLHCCITAYLIVAKHSISTLAPNARPLVANALRAGMRSCAK